VGIYEYPEMMGHSDLDFPSRTEKHANICRFDALTLDAHYAVTNLVHHVSKAAPGSANTKGSAKCPALRRAAAFHVTNVAPIPSHVDINVQEPVVKCVLRGIATNVPINLTLELNFSK
jgi:hypothetical protein